MLSDSQIALLHYRANSSDDSAIRILQENGLWEEPKEVKKQKVYDEYTSYQKDTHKDPNKRYRRDITLRQDLYLACRRKRLRISTLINQLLESYLIKEGFVFDKSRTTESNEVRGEENAQ